MTLKDALDKLYEDIESAPSFSAKIEAYLRNNAVHSRHRRIVKKKFPRRKIIARFPFEIFMADLLEYPQYKHVNRNYVFALIIIDCFTKKIWAVPMKRKTSEYTAQAFESVFRDFDQFPIHIVTDRGLEFYNTEVQKIFKNYGINHYSIPTRTKWKASMAERVIRTLKSRLQKYFVKFKTHKWIDVLPQIVNDYNATPHSSHGIAPQDVTHTNRESVYKRLYPDISVRTVCRLKIGDKVRKIIDKDLFEKGYKASWSEEIYTITKVKQRNGVCWYYLSDLNQQKLRGKKLNLLAQVQIIQSANFQGIWYYYQLNLVSRENVDQLEGGQS